MVEDTLLYDIKRANDLIDLIERVQKIDCLSQTNALTYLCDSLSLHLEDMRCNWRGAEELLLRDAVCQR